MSLDAVSQPREMDLEEAMEAERRHVEAALVRSVESLREDLGNLHAVAEHGVLGGGKRVRPILCVAAFRATGGSSDAPIHDLAVSLELIHAYSLMHDDLPCMDDAALRRGRATSHLRFGEEETMMAGAALIPAAALQAWKAARVLSLDEGRCRRIVRELLGAA
ncbi:MAG: polyprenyl synthetase family protein, partial [Longimicrobiales bacterium]